MQTLFLTCAMAAVAILTGCSSTTISAAMDQNAFDKKVQHDAVRKNYIAWRKGEIEKPSVEAARFYMLPDFLHKNRMSLHFSGDPFTEQLFVFVLANRTDEINWTPTLIDMLKSRSNGCDRARQANSIAMIEMSKNIYTPTIDSRTGLPLVQGARKFDQTTAAVSGTCNGVAVLNKAFQIAQTKHDGSTEKNPLEIE